MLASLHETRCFRVVGRSDLARLIGFERQRQLAGCQDAACLAEIAGALGVDLLAAGDLGRIADSSAHSLKIISVRGANVVARGVRTTQDEAELPGLARELAERVARDAGCRPSDWKPGLAVRAGMGGHTGMPGLGFEVRTGPIALAVGSGTHLLSGGLSWTPSRGRGGLYVDAHVARVRPGLLATWCAWRSGPPAAPGSTAITRWRARRR